MAHANAQEPPNTDLIPREFWVSRQGKWSVLYAGLINYAHKVGLKKIETNLIQIPNEQTNRVAIMMATVTMADDRIFTGFGDAAANNVAPAMQTCLLRMAETRAKARALRDAVNIGAVAYEELSDEEETGQRTETSNEAQRATPKQSPQAEASPLQVVNGGPRDFSAEMIARAESLGFMDVASEYAMNVLLHKICNYPLTKKLSDTHREWALEQDDATWNAAIDYAHAQTRLEKVIDTLDMGANAPTPNSTATLEAIAR